MARNMNAEDRKANVEFTVNIVASAFELFAENLKEQASWAEYGENPERAQTLRDVAYEAGEAARVLKQELTTILEEVNS